MVSPAQTTNVTTLRLVTNNVLVTQETTVAQALSPLSPVSPLKLYIKSGSSFATSPPAEAITPLICLDCSVATPN